MLCFFYIEHFCHVSSEGHLVEWLVELKVLPSQNNAQKKKKKKKKKKCPGPLFGKNIYDVIGPIGGVYTTIMS